MFWVFYHLRRYQSIPVNYNQNHTFLVWWTIQSTTFENLLLTFTGNLAFREQEKHKLSNWIYLKFNLVHFGEMSVPGNVCSGKCPFGELSFGKLSFGELSVREMSSGNCPSGKSPSGKCPSGNCPDTNSNKSSIYKLLSIFE